MVDRYVAGLFAGPSRMSAERFESSFSARISSSSSDAVPGIERFE
jgi:hypothetical protein